MSLKLKYSIRLALVIACLVGSLSFFLYIRFQNSLRVSAEKNLEYQLEHVWQHVTEHGINATELSTLKGRDIYIRIWKGKELLVDLIPTESEGESLTREIKRTINGIPVTVTGNYDLRDDLQHIRKLAYLLLLGNLATSLLSIPFSIWIISSLLAPFRDLSQKTSELGVKDLSFRFKDLDSSDEFGQLAKNFNSLLERLQKSFSQLRRFGSQVSHEFRTPIAVIQGEAQVMLRKPRETSEYVEALKNINAQTQLLKLVISRLLFFADLERIEQEHRLVEIQVDDVFKDTLKALRFTQEQGDKVIEVQGLEKPLVFWGYPELFGSVVNNLLENAFKYSRSKIRVLIMKEAANLKLFIEDDGPGVNLENSSELFEPFVRGDMEKNDLQKTGHGLGLSIVKASVDAVRGNIELGTSTLGGLLVEVSLPECRPTV